MKYILLLSALLFSLAAFSQPKNDSTSIKLKRFSVGITLSPDHCHRSLTKNNDRMDDSTWHAYKAYEDSIESPKFGYTAGLNFSYDFTQRFSLDIGIQYSNKGYKSHLRHLVNIDPFGNLTYGEATSFYSFYYLDFPLRANFTFFSSRFRLVVSAGAALNVFRKSTFKIVPGDANMLVVVGSDHRLAQKINISPFISTGLRYTINERMNIRMMPAYRYSLLNIFGETSDKGVHLWSYGLEVAFYSYM